MDLTGKIAKGREAGLFLALFAWYLLYPHAGFSGLIPDNICQTAYWSLLTRPHLIGSIGSSSPKGGLIVLLGAAQFLSYEVIGSAWPFKAGLALFISTSVFLISRIAADIAGQAAGLLALIVAVGSSYLTLTFFAGSSNLFFVPLTLLGLWLLARNRDRVAVLCLSVALTVRPEALAIIALIIAFRALAKGRWKRVLEFSAYAGAALTFFLLMAYWVQGSWERFGAGASTGYPPFASLRSYEHFRKVFGQLLSDQSVTLLVLPALVAFFRLQTSRVYLYYFSITLIPLVLVWIDFFGMHYRYIASVQVVVIAAGCGGLFCLYRELAESGPRRLKRATLCWAAVAAGVLLVLTYWATGRLGPVLTMLVIPLAYMLAALGRQMSGSARPVVVCHVLVVLMVGVIFIGSAFNTRREFAALIDTPHPAIMDALEFLERPVVPEGTTILAEDELLNYILVKKPDYFRGVHSVQSFNIMSVDRRRQLLHQTQYLYLSKRRNHGWNYLFYLPRAKWLNDPFRGAVHEMLRSNRPQSMLGVTISPIHQSETRFAAKIVPDGSAYQEAVRSDGG